MRRCDCFQSMLYVAGDAELDERWDCVGLKLPASKVSGTMTLSEYSGVDCGDEQCRPQILAACNVHLALQLKSFKTDLTSDGYLQTAKRG